MAITAKAKKIDTCVQHDITENTRNTFDKIIADYNDRINPKKLAVGSMCNIRTVGLPIQQKAYSRGIHSREIIDKMIRQLEIDDIIEEYFSPWSSPVVLVKKKDGSSRMCIDYRQVNDVTTTDAHPIPNTAELFETIGRVKPQFFSLIDLKGGFHQMLIAPEDRDKTAFISHRGLWQYKRLPFGMTNAPPQFQRFVNNKLRHLDGGNVVVYIDDILIFTQNLMRARRRN